MRFLTLAVLSVSTLAFIPGSFATQVPNRDPPSVQPNAYVYDGDFSTYGNRWREPNGYKPCPADVLLADGRHACLGTPD
jgi:hypothetical protein